MRPLEGIKVVEFSTHVVVPIAARVLADWGAEVIKIEAAAGDPWRFQGQTSGDNLPVEDDCNPVFSVLSSGKRLVSLNLKTPEGKEALLKILETADVFMSNIRWAGIQRLGLDWDTLHAKFPRLIYFHFNGYGYEGPGKDLPGYDLTALWARTGASHELREGSAAPTMFPGGLGDAAVSNSVIGGITAALYHREKTGEGLRLTTSLYANGIWYNFARVIACQERPDDRLPPVTPRRAEDFPNPLANVYQCGDGEWILLALNYEKVFARAMHVFGLDEFADDERYSTLEGMQANARPLYAKMVEAMKRRSSTEWAAILEELDSPYQVLLHSGDVAKDEQAWANHYLTRLECPNGDTYAVPNSPVSFFGIDLPDTGHAGGIGCDTSAVLSEYGYTPEQIQSLLDRGIAAGK